MFECSRSCYRARVKWEIKVVRNLKKITENIHFVDVLFDRWKICVRLCILVCDRLRLCFHARCLCFHGLRFRIPAAAGCLHLRIPAAAGCLRLRIPAAAGCLDVGITAAAHGLFHSFNAAVRRTGA